MAGPCCRPLRPPRAQLARPADRFTGPPAYRAPCPEPSQTILPETLAPLHGAFRTVIDNEKIDIEAPVPEVERRIEIPEAEHRIEIDPPEEAEEQAACRGRYSVGKQNMNESD